MADDDGKYEEVAVLGHDNIWHNCKQDGTTLCGMGRHPRLLKYDVVPVGCMFCIALVADGFRPMLNA